MKTELKKTSKHYWFLIIGILIIKKAGRATFGIKIGSLEIIEVNGSRIYFGNSNKPYCIGSIRRRTIQAVINFFQKTFLTPIYYVTWSRDCDMCESTSTGMDYGRKNYEAEKQLSYEGAEGPMTFTEITKGEYEDFIEPPVRDRIMEAYENGNGSSIYV